MTAYRVRVLLEDYDKDTDEEAATRHANKIAEFVHSIFPTTKVITYVEANPPLDEIEEWL